VFGKAFAHSCSLARHKEIHARNAQRDMEPANGRSVETSAVVSWF
jgi:hypothetical protein